MPNWCNNSITITGPAHKLQAIWDLAQLGEDQAGGFLQALCPMPAELINTTAPSTEANWYDWRVAHWGTKWDVDVDNMYLEQLESGQAEITGGFDSAWSPPVDALQAYAEANPDVSLEIKYFEPGMCFIGIWNTDGADGYWDDVNDLVEDQEEIEDQTLLELMEFFDVQSWYADTAEDDLTETAEADQNI